MELVLTPVAVVGVLGLLTQQTGCNADLVDLAGAGGAHLMTYQTAKGGRFKGLLDKLAGLLAGQNASARVGGKVAGIDGLADDIFDGKCHFGVLLLYHRMPCR